MRVKRIAIAGGGMIGLATALELARRGHAVTVLERGQLLQQSSWAAAGMLAAGDPENPQALAPLARFSLSLYPAFLASLEAAGAKVLLNTHSTLQVCGPEAAHGRAGAISIAEAQRLVPGLRIEAGEVPLWLDEASLDPRELGRALAAAVRAAGVDVCENTPLVSVAERGAGLLVRTPETEVMVDALVVTMGAWSAQHAGLHTLPVGAVVPRKGQILRVRHTVAEQLKTVLRSSRIYIVPRADGSVVVGATVEDAGFDRTVRETSTKWLLEQAGRLWSPLEDVTRAHVDEVWTGLRPGTADDLPMIGSLLHPRVLFATGHHRNGILLAPGTAQVLAQLIGGEESAVDLRPFRPNRFVRDDAFSRPAAVFSEAG